MSDHAAIPDIPVPAGWSEMTEAEKDRFVNDALVRIAADAGVDVTGPGDPTETFEAVEG